MKNLREKLLFFRICVEINLGDQSVNVLTIVLRICYNEIVEKMKEICKLRFDEEIEALD